MLILVAVSALPVTSPVKSPLKETPPPPKTSVLGLYVIPLLSTLRSS